MKKCLSKSFTILRKIFLGLLGVFVVASLFAFMWDFFAPLVQDVTIQDKDILVKGYIPDEECEHRDFDKVLCYRRKALLGDNDAYFNSVFFSDKSLDNLEGNEFVSCCKWFGCASDEEVLRKAEEGDATAQSQLGSKYSCLRDYEKAIFWFKKAAENGLIREKIIVAEMYERGLGVPQDYNKAIEWYKSAEDGCKGYEDASFSHISLARYKLGEIYKKLKDYQNAMEWYYKAQTGCFGVQYHPECAFFGEPNFGPDRMSEAENTFWYYYHRAEEKKKRDMEEGRNQEVPVLSHTSKPVMFNRFCGAAYYRLGEMYEKGFGVEPNSSKATDFYYQAAVFGDMMAPYHLGRMYLAGERTETRLLKAKKLIGASKSYYAKAFLRDYPEFVERGHSKYAKCHTVTY